MKILHALEKFQIQLQADGRSEHTIGQYRRHIRLFARWAADVGHGSAVEDICHEDIAAFLASPVARTRPDGGLKSSRNCWRRKLGEETVKAPWILSTAFDVRIRSCPSR